MGRSLQVLFAGLGTVAVVGSGYLALGGLQGSERGAPAHGSARSAVVAALPGTSNPALGREVLPHQAPAPIVAPVAAAEQGEWAARRAEIDGTLWQSTQATVQAMSSSGQWSAQERDDVVEALAWRHDQMVTFRGALQRGEVGAAEGRAALVEVANKARATVIVAVGVERATALDKALASSEVGAGL